MVHEDIVKDITSERDAARIQRDELLAMLKSILTNEGRTTPDFSRWILLVAKAGQLVAKIEASK